MSRVVLAILMVLFTGMAKAGPPVVLSVQGHDIPPYEEAMSGFQSVCKAQIDRIILSELDTGDAAKHVRKIHRGLIVAIGPDALRAIQPYAKAPIVYLMVLDPDPAAQNADNSTGVSMNIPQEKQVFIIRSVLPGTAHIGLIYNPKQTGHLVERGRKAAEGLGIGLLSSMVQDAREVPAALSRMAPRPDALWLLPDLSVLTPETVEFIFSFSMSNKIPLVSFSEKYLKLGAFMAISFDVFDMGRQAGEMANEILSGMPVKQVPPAEARKAMVTVNGTVAAKLGISLKDVTLENFSIIE